MSEIKVDIFDYVINGYSQSQYFLNSREYKTTSINDVDDEECSIIKVVNHKDELHHIRSCDIIKSDLELVDPSVIPTNIPTIDKNSKLYFELIFDGVTLTSNDLIQFTHVNGAKKTSPSTINLTNITNNMKNIYCYKFASMVIKEMTDLLKEDNPGKKSFVKWFSPTKWENIILFGDVHGSYSTLIRHLLRFRKLGIIGQDGKILKDYTIIFLGDIVDRGVYSYESLIILYILKILNPTQIILNRGNHEELATNIRYGLKEELDYKFKDKGKDIFLKLNLIMNLQPSAIVVENPFNDKENVYLAHGAFPHDFTNNDKLPLEFIDGLKTKSSFAISDKHAYGMRWNDIHGQDETVDNIARINPSNDPNINKENTPCFETIKVIGKNLIHHAKEMGIKMIIRGHQDSFCNSKIMKYDEITWSSIKEYTIQNQATKLKCKGSMYTVSVNDNKLIINDDEEMKFDAIPALTISTNTDKGRNLKSDSYAILQFTDKKRTETCFSGGGMKTYYEYNKNLFKLFRQVP